MKTVILNTLFAFSLAAAQGLAAHGAHASIRDHRSAAAAAAPRVSAPAHRLAGEAHQWDRKLAAGEANQFGSKQTASGEANQFGSKQTASGEANQFGSKQTAAGEGHQFPATQTASGEANQFGSRQIG